MRSERPEDGQNWWSRAWLGGIHLLAWLLVLASPNLVRAQEAPAEVVVITSELRFNPHTVRVQAGDVVEWQNQSGFAHTVTARPDQAMMRSHVELPADAEPFGSEEINPGGSYRHRFEVPGVYRYFCIPHEMAGMLGVVVVEPR